MSKRIQVSQVSHRTLGAPSTSTPGPTRKKSSPTGSGTGIDTFVVVDVQSFGQPMSGN